MKSAVIAPVAIDLNRKRFAIAVKSFFGEEAALLQANRGTGLNYCRSAKRSPRNRPY